jgi:hypothetical protein
VVRSKENMNSRASATQWSIGGLHDLHYFDAIRKLSCTKNDESPYQVIEEWFVRWQGWDECHFPRHRHRMLPEVHA